MNHYISWVGAHDLTPLKDSHRDKNSLGPIMGMVDSDIGKKIDHFHLIHGAGYLDDLFMLFQSNLKKITSKGVTLHRVNLKDPTSYRHIYEIVRNIFNQYSDPSINWHIQTSSGTPQMAAIWLLIATTFPKKNMTLYQGHYHPDQKRSIMTQVEIPFNIALSFLPDLQKGDEQLTFPGWDRVPEYSNIMHHSQKMSQLLKVTWRISKFNVPVLIQGETGTGKELFAQAIHATSARKNKIFKTFNCAAVQDTLAESTLFGWAKGAFTNALKDSKGIFEQAEGGTVFLDEIGDLSMDIQRKMLRFLECGEIQRAGDGFTKRVDVRIVAATHKNLLEMIQEGTFREDLYYRLSVAVLKLPALRERREDILPLADHFLEKINHEFSQVEEIEYQKKQLSAESRLFLEREYWAGNVRDLYHVLERAAIWEESGIIIPELLQSVMIDRKEVTTLQIPKVEHLESVDLQEILFQTEAAYIKAALKKTGGHIKKSAERLGYNSFQNMTTRMKKMGISVEDYKK